MRMIALLVLSFRSQELCYSLCQLSAFLMGRHISARFYFAVSLSSACNSKQLGFLLVYAVDAHSVPWFERHLLRPGQKVSLAASRGTVTLLLVHKATKGTTRKVKAVDRKPWLSAPIWLGSCCQLLPCSRVLRKVTAFVLPSSLLQASPVSVAFALPSLKQQAQCFAKLRTYLLNAAATLLRKKHVPDVHIQPLLLLPYHI